MTDVEKGQTRWLNISYATRNPDITIEESLYNAHDTYLPKLRKVSGIALAIALLFVVFTVILMSKGSWLLAIPLALVALIALFFSRASMAAGGGSAYKSGLLIPAEVTSTNPVQIVALANISNKDDDDDEQSDETEVQWAAKRLNIPSLPLHEPAVGQRVPCAALFGGSSKGLHVAFEPRPLSWATSNIEEIKRNEEVITQEEWDFLQEIVDRVPEHEEDQIALFDHDGNFEKTM